MFGLFLVSLVIAALLDELVLHNYVLSLLAAFGITFVGIFLLGRLKDGIANANRKREDEIERVNRVREGVRNKVLNDERMQQQLTQRISDGNQLVANMPTIIADAETYLDNAEEEFAAGVFAPFWEEIEKAAIILDIYHRNLRTLIQIASECNNHAALLPASVKPLTLFQMKLYDARPTASRLTNVVRKAQGNIHFALIYQQMKMNTPLYLGKQISSSLGELSDRLHVSLDEMMQTP